MGYPTVSHLVLTDILLLSLLYSKCQSFQQFSHDRVAVPYIRTGFGSIFFCCQMLGLHPQPGGAFDVGSKHVWIIATIFNFMLSLYVYSMRSHGEGVCFTNLIASQRRIAGTL